MRRNRDESELERVSIQSDPVGFIVCVGDSVPIRDRSYLKGNTIEEMRLGDSCAVISGPMSGYYKVIFNGVEGYIKYSRDIEWFAVKPCKEQDIRVSNEYVNSCLEEVMRFVESKKFESESDDERQSVEEIIMFLRSYIK